MGGQNRIASPPRPIRLPLPLLFALALLALAGCGTNSHPLATASNSTHAAVVTRNTDGDTVWLSGIGKVRVIGVDTPEVFGKTECFGHEASAFAERVLPPGTHVRYRLGVDPRDRYGRALAYIWLQDGRMFNELLADRGYATPMTIPPNVEYADRFVAAARRARQALRGLWRACA
jgi:micrococcal nuclease